MTLLKENKWELKDHTDNEGDGYSEITNGTVSICTNDWSDENKLQQVVDLLNDSGFKFYSNNALELAQHIQIMQLQEDQRQARLSVTSLRYSIDQALEREQRLVEALNDIAKQRTCAETEADEDIPIGSDGTRLGDIEHGYDCIIEVARKALASYKEKEGEK